MQDLKNNKWITIDPLGNTYEIYANLNLINASRIKQAELSLKDAFIKASLMFATILFEIYKSPRRKNFINSFCPKHPN